MDILRNKKLFLLPFIYYYSLSIAVLIIGVYLLAKIEPDGGVKLSFAQGNEKNYKDPQANVLLSADDKFETKIVKDLETGNVNCNEAVAKKIDTFFKNNKAPLMGYGCEFASQADLNGLNPFLVPAIGWCESNGGKVTPQFKDKESYNAFGWAVLDSNDNTRDLDAYSCDSWEHCIAKVSRGIAKKSSRGVEPTDIVKWYTPASVEKGGGIAENAPWVKCVTKAMSTMDRL